MPSSGNSLQTLSPPFEERFALALLLQHHEYHEAYNASTRLTDDRSMASSIRNVSKAGGEQALKTSGSYPTDRA